MLLRTAVLLSAAVACAHCGPADDGGNGNGPVVIPGAAQRKTPPPVRCGDKVSLRAEGNFRFVSVSSKDKSCAATARSPGLPELLTLSCATKDAGAVVELGDSVALKVERSGDLLNDGASDATRLTSDPRRAAGFFDFVVLDPLDPQARGPLLQETPFSLRSLRENLMTYARLSHKAAGTIVFDSDNTRGLPENRFRLYKFPHDVDQYKARCPADAKGNVCSGNGVCIDTRCDCNDNAVGERCDVLREEAECSAIGDVHVESFDGGLYNLYELGEYLLYAEHGSAYREAVAVFSAPWQKYNDTAVITRVTVRRNGASGENFLSFNHYGTEVRFNCDETVDYADKIRRAGPVGVTFRNGLRVTWTNSMWEVNSPSRLRVRVRPRAALRLTDVFVGVNTPRLGTAEGLCGNNDKDPENDLTPRMTKRFRNEPSAKLLEKLRVEDGRVYPYSGSHTERSQGYESGRESEAYYQCRAKATYATAQTTLLAFPGGGGKAQDVPEEQRNQVRTSIETALSAGYCLGSPRMKDSAVACCRQVLVKARAIEGATPAPKAQLKLDMDVNDDVIAKAWAHFKGATVPQANVVKADYASCIQDICKTRVSKFCKEEKSNTELQRNNREEDINQLTQENEQARNEAVAERRA